MDTDGRAALFAMSARCADVLAPLLLDRAPLAETLRAAVKAVGEKPLSKVPPSARPRLNAPADPRFVHHQNERLVVGQQAFFDGPAKAASEHRLCEQTLKTARIGK
jgi:hypothetical protein